MGPRRRAFEALEDVETARSAHEGDKVGGWPFWVQNPEWGACRKCGDAMRVILQLDSEDNTPWMFGDTGTGHLSQCPKHPDVLAFAWAC